LFLQRARRAHVGFDATTDDYPVIVRICKLVDGMPLAVELAATWVRTLTCAEIADEIERSLDFLSVSARDIPPRHRSMRAVFDHSWELLSDDERRALARLSVFRGGFGREAAEEVGGASLTMLAGLVAKSLVRRPESGRYDLHELIRQYAALYLEADPAANAAARQQHYAFYLVLAEGAGAQLKGSVQLEWLRRLEQEHDNFRAALAWSLAGGQNDSALRLAGALRFFWGMRGYFDEGHTWLIKALQQTPEKSSEASARARALEGLALLDNAVGKHADALALAEQSEALFRNSATNRAWPMRSWSLGSACAGR
jgi:predicted ATPase